MTLAQRLDELRRQMAANQRELDWYTAEAERERALREADQGARAWARAQNRREHGRAPCGADEPPGPHSRVLFGQEAAEAREQRQVYERDAAWARRRNEVERASGARERP